MTQGQFATRGEITVKTVSRLEAADISPRAKTLAGIDRAAGWVSGSARRVMRGEQPSLLDEQGRYPASLQDEVERRLWDIEDLDTDDRWTQIYVWRAKRDERNRALRDDEDPTQKEQSW